MQGFSLTGALAVAVGAVAGAWLRWALALGLNRAEADLPLGTLVANLGGGFLAGAILAWLARRPDLVPEWRLVAVTGFLGALTTFSTFSAESLGLLQRGAFVSAALHSTVHLVGSLGAAAVGWRILR